MREDKRGMSKGELETEGKKKERAEEGKEREGGGEEGEGGGRRKGRRGAFHSLSFSWSLQVQHHCGSR